MNKPLLLSCLFSLTVAMGVAREVQPKLVQAAWTQQKVQLRFPVVVERDVVASPYAVVVTPQLCGAKDTLALTPIIFRGAKNRKLVERARYFKEQPEAASREYALGDTVWVEQELSLQAAENAWLKRENVALTLAREADGCCEVYELTPQPLDFLTYVPPFVPTLGFVEDNAGRAGKLKGNHPVLQHISKYRPYDDTRILRKEEGALYVHFPLDKIDLRYNFRDNAHTLDEIVSLTDQIMADSTSTVKLIQIIGLASPEGAVKRNQWLGEGRAQALKDYVKRHAKARLTDDMFECINGGEAWNELRSQIEETEFEGRDALLDIIRHTPDPDLRERRMKALDGGRPYAYVKANILADQRNSGYMRIYYDYVPDEAARAINEASELLKREQYAEALRMLQPLAHDKRSHNALGVALYMMGREAEALDYFRRAAAEGDTQAADNLRQLER